MSVRAELEACDQGAVQGKRARVLQVATLIRLDTFPTAWHFSPMAELSLEGIPSAASD
jgi:hypothetical protein